MALTALKESTEKERRQIDTPSPSICAGSAASPTELMNRLPPRLHLVDAARDANAPDDGGGVHTVDGGENASTLVDSSSSSGESARNE